MGVDSSGSGIDHNSRGGGGGVTWLSCGSEVTIQFPGEILSPGRRWGRVVEICGTEQDIGELQGC